ncbi:iron complex outermembrane receptor protein [Pedobacter sp. CAN_A7]|uniref:TonB-dependent receptor n=1 Tax=Pedobacter sp. CAN_A7 TaxID=2787722 RepID=UPI0018C9293F
MKRFQLVIAMLFLFLSVRSNAAVLIQFKGKVIDAQTQQGLPGAVISIPDLRVAAITNADGEFTLKNIPGQGSFLVQIRYMGYETLTRMVDFSNIETNTFSLKQSVIEGREVVITGTATSSNSRKNSTSISTVSKAELLAHPSTNLVDALSRVPGVSQITTGNGISKPVIRGLSGNRILTLNNGVKQQGQQWGDEHGLEIDQYSADRVEVLRGPASLLYGSDALGGVINVLDALPAPEGTLQGELLSNYATNSGLTGTSLMLQGNENGFVYRARGSYKNAHSFKTPTGYLPNSGFNETSFNGQLGLNKHWGYAHLDVSSFRTNLGFYEPAVNAAGQFVDEDENTFTNDQLTSRSLAFPKQDVRHFKIAMNSNILFNSGSLKTTLGYQKNNRKELEAADEVPELLLNMHTYTYDFKYSFKPVNGWAPVIGTSAEFIHSLNTEGMEALIPDFDSQSYGAFVYVKKTWDKNTINAGARFDYHQLDGKEHIAEEEMVFQNFKNKFSNVSAGIGYTHEFNEQLGFKANAGSAFRAPNIAELSSNGVHEGTFRYEIGNSNLKAEQSYQFDASLDYQTSTLSASIGGFVNHINNFIFYNTTGETIDEMQVYRSVQRDALLRGLEASLTLHPVEFLHIENSFSYTRATNKATDQPLPFIPAAALRNELRFEPSIPGTEKTYLSLGLDNFFKQNRVDEFETATGAYSLLNAAVGTTLKLGKTQEISLYVSGKNLLNKKYYDHLSRYKPGRLDAGDPTFGVYNPGRNITFGLIMPFNLK